MERSTTGVYKSRTETRLLILRLSAKIVTASGIWCARPELAANLVRGVQRPYDVLIEHYFGILKGQRRGLRQGGQ